MSVTSTCRALLLGIGLCLVSVATPADVEAQSRCSRCTSCSRCRGSDWGGNGCTFSGGCCSETGGNCNPQLTLMVKPTLLRTVEVEEGSIFVARLDDTVYGAWDCDGEMNIAFREVAAGHFTQLTEEEMEPYRERYPLPVYLKAKHTDGNR